MSTLSLSGNTAWHVLFVHEPLEESVRSTLETSLFDCLRNALCEKVSFRLKAALVLLMRVLDVSLLPLSQTVNVFDVAVAAWLLDSDHSHCKSFTVRDLFEFYCGKRPVVCNIPEDLVAFDVYMFMSDHTRHLSLWKQLRGRLEQQKLTQVMVEQEMPTMLVLTEMERGGICFQKEKLLIHVKYIEKELERMNAMATAMLGHDVLLTSPQAVAAVLFDEMKLKPPTSANDSAFVRSQKLKSRSTSEAVLSKLAPLHPFARLVQQHRTLSKQLTGFIRPLLDVAFDVDAHTKKDRDEERREKEMEIEMKRQGIVAESERVREVGEHSDREEASRVHHGPARIFTTWNQISTGTGRLSSSEPNLQNLPKNTSAPISLSHSLEDEDNEEAVDVRSPPRRSVSSFVSSSLTHSLSSSPSSSSSSTATSLSRSVSAPLPEQKKETSNLFSIRDAFVAQSDAYELLAVDYAQMEMRLLAHLCVCICVCVCTCVFLCV